jgi:thiol-disulfide isomerase/thioredoxin
MARTFTKEIPLGFTAPEFNLPEPRTGRVLSLGELKSDKATLVVFICNHCPYVKHILPALIEIGREYVARGVSFIAISSNDVENYPDDHPDRMKELAQELDFPFPYLYDESQDVAKAYDAACTPDFNLFDGNMRCVYRGQFDSTRPSGSEPANGDDLRKALDLVLEGKMIPTEQTPSVGCNIKWKS